MKINRKRMMIVLLVTVFILTCFFREFIFLNINEQSRVAYYHSTDSHVASSMQWLSNMSYSALWYSKWLLTFLFIAILAFLSSQIIRIGFENKAWVRISWLVYASITGLSALLYGISLLAGNRDLLYDTARFFAGLAEGPALLLVLCGSFLAMKQVRSQ
jgi:hypothetical protein